MNKKLQSTEQISYDHNSLIKFKKILDNFQYDKNSMIQGVQFPKNSNASMLVNLTVMAADVLPNLVNQLLNQITVGRIYAAITV